MVLWRGGIAVKLRNFALAWGTYSHFDLCFVHPAVAGKHSNRHRRSGRGRHGAIHRWGAWSTRNCDHARN